MPTPKQLDSLWKRYDALRKALAALGPILQGSILQRRLKRPLLSLKGKERVYGPYYQWTQKREGKTVNVNLGRFRAAAVAKAIRENRRLERFLSQMRLLSLQIVESTTPDVSRRSARRIKRKS
jgi:hypothetical protein